MLTIESLHFALINYKLPTKPSPLKHSILLSSGTKNLTIVVVATDQLKLSSLLCSRYEMPFTTSHSNG
ncbi:hypothetical protein L6452_43433 [Arctium lappa]|uniref:Uncharacterized protein n=1 Tax=Arctium lappa TaxID=4217 RepID=A0ACB8XEM2_ARCLA|nr:hypothetical protein L6452_43433 [Arctium lappa]